MNKLTRIFLTAGMSAAFAMSAGAGVAQAAPQDVRSAGVVSLDPYDEKEFHDWYDSKRECRSAGIEGKDDDEWYDFRCEKGRGKHSDEWALWVAYEYDEYEDEDDYWYDR
ncbi:hypothetical protein AB0M02_35225 [Actinoplanes sp. NPDC051861]|uniref:hypothetical protein n=1 Tax=Actinoplanes sp. NPDC051861 TaxID=3155170 RepID=UPI003428A9B1